jgi:hypothetical protein
MEVQDHNELTLGSQKLVIRKLEPQDAPLMAGIEAQVWDGEHAASLDLIRDRLIANSGSSLGAFMYDTSDLVGFCTLVIASESDVRPLKPWSHYAQLSVKPWTGGEILYGIDLTVAESAPRGTATSLMKELLQHGRQLGMNRVIAVTRAPSFHLVKNEMSFDKYFNRLRDGSLRESLYHLMVSAGLEATGFCSDYYPDEESGNYGLIFEARI